MKKKIILACILIICLSLITGTTLAYFTYQETARNVISSGSVVVNVVEQQKEGDTLKPYPKDPVRIMPGTSVSKIVAAHCKEAEAWVRMAYTVEVYDKNGEQMELDQQALERIVCIAVDETKWIEKDGWWYYPESVNADETTKPLFETVEFAAGMGNEFQRCMIYIDVIAQAVQTVNNGNSVMEAAGWPEA